MMYDVTDAKSFKAIPKWLKETWEKADEHVKCLLIPNKVDLPNKIPRLRAVSDQEAWEFAEKNDLLYAGECSAMQNINIKQCIERLAEEINKV